MTSLAVNIEGIDTALVTKYSGMTINVAGVSTAVEVFLEEPNIEQVDERVYPSVSIKLMSILPDLAVSESDEDDNDYEEVSYDSVSSPNEREMRLKPKPYSILYSIDTWHRVLVSESRDLLEVAILQKITPRDYLSVTNIDGDSVDCWMFWSGGVTGNDEKESDVIIYHKTLTLEVRAHLTRVDADDTTDEKVAMEGQWAVYKLSPTEDQVAVDSDKELDVNFRVTDTIEEPVT